MGDFFRVWKTEDVLRRIIPPALLALAAGYLLGAVHLLYLCSKQ